MTDSTPATAATPDYPALIRALVRALSDDWPVHTKVTDTMTYSHARQLDSDVREAEAYFGNQTIKDYCDVT